MTEEEKNSILELIEIIEEQQELITLLLKTYPEKTQPVKDEMTATTKRIRLKTKNLKRKLTRGIDE
jgi:hypothetical protein